MIEIVTKYTVIFTYMYISIMLVKGTTEIVEPTVFLPRAFKLDNYAYIYQKLFLFSLCHFYKPLNRLISKIVFVIGICMHIQTT